MAYLFPGNTLRIQGRQHARVVILFLCFFDISAIPVDAFCALGGESRQFVSRTWSVDNGLPANGIHTILRTADGYLWIGTEGGLVRFNGRDFDTFDSDRYGVLSYQGITCFAEGAKGELWIGTWGGGLYRKSENLLESYTVEDGLESNFIKDLHIDEHGGVWIGTRRGLNIAIRDSIESRSHMFELLDIPIMSLLGLTDGTILIGTYGNGLIQSNGDEFERYAVDRISNHERVTALQRDDEKRIVVGTAGNGVIVLSDTIAYHLNLPDEMLNSAITALMIDGENDLWIGSQNNLLMRLSSDWRFGNTNVVNTYSVSAWDIHEDLEQNIWIGTDHNGMLQLYESTIHMVSPGEAPYAERVSAIAEDDYGNIWLGTEESGLHILQDESIIHIKDPAEIDNDIVTMMKRLPDGSILVNFLRSGLFQFNNNTLHKVLDSSELPIHNVTDAIQYDNTLILCINGYGLLNIEDNKILPNRYNEMLTSKFTTSMLRTHDGSLWIGTYDRGLFRCIEDTVMIFDEDAGLSNNSIRSLSGEDWDNIWICTYGGGLNYLEPEKCTRISIEDGLHSRFVYQMIDDGTGQFWVSSNKGIFSLQKDMLKDFIEGRITYVECRTFGKNDGLSTLECNGAGGYRASDGKIWIPTTQGAAVLDPRNIGKNTIIPPVYIEDIIVDGNYRLRNRHPISEERDVYSGRNRFEFRFAALSLVEPEKVRFQYRLLGFEDGWINSGNIGLAYYTNLPFGEYIFEVIASNDDGLWNKDGARYSFSVNRRFHETGMFFVLCSLGLILSGSALYSLRVRQLRKRQKELQLLVQQQTQDLREANERLERLANLDGLTGVANRRSFDRILEVEWKRALRLKRPVSLVFVDIDYFKSFNDTYGHIAGDECLKTVARCLDSKVKRSGDLVARYGGEEFAVLLPNLPEKKAYDYAENLRVFVESQEITHNGSSICDILTISIGVSTMIPTKYDPPSVLVDKADDALYRAKKSGRNRVVSETRGQ